MNNKEVEEYSQEFFKLIFALPDPPEWFKEELVRLKQSNNPLEQETVRLIEDGLALKERAWNLSKDVLQYCLNALATKKV